MKNRIISITILICLLLVLPTMALATPAKPEHVTILYLDVDSNRLVAGTGSFQPERSGAYELNNSSQSVTQGLPSGYSLVGNSHYVIFVDIHGNVNPSTVVFPVKHTAATPPPSTTPKPEATPTTAPTPTVDPSTTPKPEATPTTAPTPTVNPSTTPKPEATPTADPSPSATPKPTATIKPTAKPTATIKPSAKPTATQKPTAKPAAKPSASPKSGDASAAIWAISAVIAAAACLKRK